MTVDAAPSFNRYPYTGFGGYSFYFDARLHKDVSVTYLGTSGEVVSLVLDSDYAVSLLSDNSGGSVEILDSGTTRPLVDGSITISRVLALEQEVKFVNNHALPMETIETSFDRIVMMMQQLDTTVTDGTIIINWRGDWATLNEYQPQDLAVGSNGNWYVCITSHTSGIFADDLTSGYWVIALDISEVELLKDQAEAARDDAEAASDDSHAAEVQAGLSEVNAGISAQESANCRQDAYDSAVSAAADATSASTDADRAEAAANVIPDPSAGAPGDVAIINGTQDGWVYDAGGGGGLVWSQAPSNSETGEAGKGLLFETSSALSTFTLPASPSEGDSVGVGDGSGNAGEYRITVTSTDTIMGLSEDFYLESDNQSLIFSYINSNWAVTGGMSSLGIGDIVTMHDTGLYPLPGNAYVTGNMYGLDYRKTGDHTISVDAGNCMDSLNITPLVAGALQTVTIPSVINEIYNLFLCDDGIVRTDTNVDGATLLAGSVSKLRWIGFVKTNASGIITKFTMVGRTLFFETFSEVAFLTGIGTTMLAVDESPVVPVSRIENITYGGQSDTNDAILLLGDMVDSSRFGGIRTYSTQSDTLYPWASGTGTNSQNEMQPIGQVKSVSMSAGIGKIAVRGVTMKR